MEKKAVRDMIGINMMIRRILMFVSHGYEEDLYQHLLLLLVRVHPMVDMSTHKVDTTKTVE